MQKIADILPQMTKSLSCYKKYKTQLILFYWDKIVGEDVAAQSTPIGVDFGILSISVSNSVWCHHLSMMKTDLICKINQFSGDFIITDIVFKNNAHSNVLQKEISLDESLNLAQELSKIRLNEQEISIAIQKCKEITENRLKKKIFRIYKRNMVLNKYKISQNYHVCMGCDVLCPKEQKYCSVCNERQKKEIAESIRRLLSEVPWATYGEIHQYISCSPEEYIDAKISLLRLLAERVDYDDECSISAKTLTMLFTGAKHDALNPVLIKNTMSKFRRKIYVPASRN